MSSGGDRLGPQTKAQFPLLAREVHGRPIVYLDSAASSQKPQCVLDAMNSYYETINANVHRGAYEIAAQATDAMEAARARVARFVNAPSADEIVFTKNVTEAINLVARSWGGANLGPDAAVVITEMDSTTAAGTDMSGLLGSRSGTLPHSPSATQNMTTTMNPSLRRSSRR